MNGAAQASAQRPPHRGIAGALPGRIQDRLGPPRRILAGPARLADEQAFLPTALSLQETPVHPAPRRIAYMLMALFVTALAWAPIGKIDIVAVAPGRIIVSQRTKVVQPLARSVVQRILVKDGDHVDAGQALVALDPTAAQADKASLHETRKAAQSEWLRTRALQKMLSSAGQKSRTRQAQQTPQALFDEQDPPQIGRPKSAAKPRPNGPPNGATSPPAWPVWRPSNAAARPRWTPCRRRSASWKPPCP